MVNAPVRTGQKLPQPARKLKTMAMPGIRHLVAAFACVAAIAAAGNVSAQDAPKPDVPKWFADMLDSSTLPRIPGSIALFENKAATSFVVRDKVADASEATRALLVADGWQQYIAPFTAYAVREDHSIMSFKKGWQGLSVSIGVAPAQGGATAIQYAPLVTKNDLPFPRDATEIEYAPERPVLLCVTAETVETTLAFFVKELAGLGYAEWSIKIGARKAAADRAGEMTQAGGHAYFVHDEKKPLQLVLARAADGKTKVDLKAVPQDLLDAQTRQAKSASEMADVMALPRPDGAHVKDEDARKASPTSFTYWLDDTVPIAKKNVSKALGEDGWIAYVAPFDPPLERDFSFKVRNLSFKKGGQGVSLFFTTDGGNFSRTGVSITSDRLYNNIPVPPGASAVVFEHRRPLLDAIAPGTVEDLLAFFRAELAAAGWKPWSAADAARWPNAKIEETIEDGVRAYFTRDKNDRQEPIQVSLGRRKDGLVAVEVRVPPFARPQVLKAGDETYGLPKPDRIKSASGRDGQTQRELTATVPAERDVVLAFYRREMAKLGWNEGARGPVENGDNVVLNFAKPDTTAVLKLGFKYDLTTVSLVQQLPDRIAQERAKARKDAEDQLKKRVEEVLRGPARVLEAMTAPTNSPIPVPDTAEKVNFDAARGDVKFTSPSRVTEIAAFYRAAIKPLGFSELPAVIAHEAMTELNFMRGGKRLFITIMQMGERTDVRGYGPGLVAFAAEPRKPQAVKNTASASEAFEDLEAEADDGLPVPKKHTFSTGSKTPFRIEREAGVIASLDSTLAFYRRELGKLGWKEESKGAIVKPQNVVLSFATPDGSGTLKLGRDGDKTTVKLTQRTPEQAIKLGVVAKPGQGLILLGSMLEAEAVVTINRRAIKVASGAGKPGADGPRVDLPPGKYKASIKVPGKPAYNEDLNVIAGETLGLLIGPGGVLPLPLN
jgi:hypothetical protein